MRIEGISSPRGTVWGIQEYGRRMVPMNHSPREYSRPIAGADPNVSKSLGEPLEEFGDVDGTAVDSSPKLLKVGALTIGKDLRLV